MAAHHAATKGGKQAFDAGSYAKSILQHWLLVQAELR
jgi:hypothetical protein